MERKMHTLPEVAGDDNEVTNSINHWSFDRMQPCEQGKKTPKPNSFRDKKKAKKEYPSYLWHSGYHMFARNMELKINGESVT